MMNEANVITSQSFRHPEIVAEKKAELAEVASIDLDVYDAGDGLYILADGHHRYEAARELGLDVTFWVVEHPEGLTGQELLDEMWIDGDYIYLATGKGVF